MSLQDAKYAIEELAAGRSPESKRALDGLHSMITSSLLSDPKLARAADLLQRYVVTGDHVDEVRPELSRPDVLAAVRGMQEP